MSRCPQRVSSLSISLSFTFSQTTVCFYLTPLLLSLSPSFSLHPPLSLSLALPLSLSTDDPSGLGPEVVTGGLGPLMTDHRFEVTPTLRALPNPFPQKFYFTFKLSLYKGFCQQKWTEAAEGGHLRPSALPAIRFIRFLSASHQVLLLAHTKTPSPRTLQWALT